MTFWVRNPGSGLSSGQACGVLNRVLEYGQIPVALMSEPRSDRGSARATRQATGRRYLVTKNGCPGGSCSYDGRAVANWDKGGVLCCAD